MTTAPPASPLPEPPPDKARVRELLGRIRALESELEAELQEHQERLLEDIRLRRNEFEASVREAQRRARMNLLRWLRESRPQSALSLPFIYGMAVPLVFLDACLTLYQHVCFRLYGIPRVRRGDYIVIDRQQLAYLNVIEKLHCVYCGYATGLLAFGCEIAARTEQYWCPIKHAHRARGTHARAERFLAYGDADDLHLCWAELRDDLAAEAGTATPRMQTGSPT